MVSEPVPHVAHVADVSRDIPELPAAGADLSWEAELVSHMRSSRVLAWRVATASGALSFLVALAMILLVVLRKQPEPQVITVDRLTGEAIVSTSLKDFETATALNNKHWIKSFVVARERYDFRLVQRDFDLVRLMAGDGPWRDYSALYSGENSLLNRNGRDIQVLPTILSITLQHVSQDGRGGMATVRYELKTVDPHLPEPVPARRVATLRFEYQEHGGIKEADAIDNPLGFTVTGYQSDPEITGGGK